MCVCVCLSACVIYFDSLACHKAQSPVFMRELISDFSGLSFPNSPVQIKFRIYV